MKALTIIVLATLFLTSCGETERTPAEKLMDSGYSAIASLQERAKLNLKYPEAAEFEKTCKIDYNDDSSGVVILQKGVTKNGFGVPIGFHYVALVSRIGQDSFTIAKFKFVQE